MRIGIVGDLHAPFIHPMYRRFCMDVFRQWSIDHVHFAGDIVDLHALSFWDHDPNGMSAEDESAKAIEDVKVWHRTFPDATVTIGNHDGRHYRRARKNGIPDRFLKTYADIWRTPRWTWQDDFILDGVLYEHGTGSSGKDAAINRALEKRLSVVIGHIHTYPGVKWHANPLDAIFGLNVGCGIDIGKYAFAYGKPFTIRPVLGCGIVLDGEYAFFERMPCGKGEKYHRSKSK